MTLYYHPRTRSFARENRNQYFMTESEGKIWNLVLRKNMTGYRFLRQKQIGQYILDFYCDKLKLGIEIDDGSHDMKGEYDERRTKYINSIGIQVVRYTNAQVDYNLDAVIVDLQINIEKKSNNIK